MFDLLIKGGLVINGKGEPGYPADIGIRGDTIAAVGELTAAPARYLIDAHGLAVAPGFIDAHSHDELYLLQDPWLEPKVRQGVTCVVLGQDGLSVAPVVKKGLRDWQQHLSGLLGAPQQEWPWRSVQDYRDYVERRGVAANLAYLVPHGNLRMAVCGLENRPVTGEELETMQRVLERALAEGACGLSTGLIYSPCSYATREELLALCRVVRRYGGVFAVHQRSEGNGLLESMEEVLSVARASGVRVHFSHFKVAGKENGRLLAAALEKLAAARDDGVEVTFDQYPYTAGSTMLRAILPPWLESGGDRSLRELLGDPAVRQRIKEDIARGIPGWDNYARLAGWEGIYISSVGKQSNSWMVGKNLQEIAAALHQDDPAGVALDLLREEGDAILMRDLIMEEQTVTRIMQEPWGMFGTDGLLSGTPHPRVYGTFPRILGRYVREQGILSLEDAIRKMSWAPARLLGLCGRGLVQEGYRADLVVFDAGRVRDEASYTNPCRYPSGIAWVVINGKVVLEKGRMSRELPGRFLVPGRG